MAVAAERARAGLSPGLSTLLGVLLLASLCAWAWQPALDNGWIWDDDAYVTRNDNLQDLEGLRAIWLEPRSLPQWYPTVHTSYWLELRLWGRTPEGEPDPFGYHLDNVLLHAACALLLWRLLRRLGLGGAFLAAALFAVHPVMVESVAWVTERKNVLSLFFALLSALAFLRAVGFRDLRPGEPVLPEEGRRKVSLRPLPAVLCALAFFLALGAKTVVAPLPLVFWLLLWWKGCRPSRGVLRFLGVLLLAGIASGLFTAWLEKEHVGAAGRWFEHGLAARFPIAGRAIWFYVLKLLWPHPIVFIYPRWEPTAVDFLGWIAFLAALALPVVLFLARRSLGRGPLVAVLVYGGVLFPALGFLDVYPHQFSFVADHFQYHASVAAFAILGQGLWQALRRLGFAGPWSQRLRRPAALAGLVAVAAVLTALSARTRTLCRDYADEEVLWRATLERNPEAWIAHNNLGRILYTRKEFEEAEAHFVKALELNPWHERAAYNLGLVRRRQGRLEEARELFEKALRITPDYAYAHQELGIVLTMLHRYEEALEHFAEVERIQTGAGAAVPPETRVSQAQALAGLGRLEEARGILEEVLAAQPGHVLARAHYGIVLARLGRTREALRALREAAAAAPGNPLPSVYQAWIRCSHESAAWRNVREARRIVDSWAFWFSRSDMAAEYLDLRAAVEAAEGDPEAAQETAALALELARRAGREDLARGIEERLAAYRDGRPWRSPTGLPSPLPFL